MKKATRDHGPLLFVVLLFLVIVGAHLYRNTASTNTIQSHISRVSDCRELEGNYFKCLYWATHTDGEFACGFVVSSLRPYSTGDRVDLILSGGGNPITCDYSFVDVKS